MKYIVMPRIKMEPNARMQETFCLIITVKRLEITRWARGTIMVLMVHQVHRRALFLIRADA